MADHIYPAYKTALLTSGANVSLDQDNTTDGPYCALVNTGIYTYSASHQFYSDLSGIVGTDQRISSPTVTNGTFDGDNPTYIGVIGSIGAIVIYRKNSGANMTWRLVLYREVTANSAGNDITITWNASGIFTL